MKRRSRVVLAAQARVTCMSVAELAHQICERCVVGLCQDCELIEGGIAGDARPHDQRQSRQNATSAASGDPAASSHLRPPEISSLERTVGMHSSFLASAVGAES